MLLSLSLSLMLASSAILDVPLADKDVPAPIIEQARQALDDQLVDYPSARFRHTYARRVSGDVIQFCGEANMKNRMGGYGGWKGFALTMGNRPEVADVSCGDITDERISPTDYSSALSSPVETATSPSQ